MSVIADTHDCICNCNGPFAHLLASIFPPGHTDRDKTINQILQRDFKECHSGGDGGESHGLGDGEKGGQQPGIKEEIPEDEKEDLDMLIAAAAAAEEEER